MSESEFNPQYVIHSDKEPLRLERQARMYGTAPAADPPEDLEPPVVTPGGAHEVPQVKSIERLRSEAAQVDSDLTHRTDGERGDR